MLVTPLLGFTTWNAFESAVTQNDVEETAQLLKDFFKKKRERRISE